MGKGNCWRKDTYGLLFGRFYAKVSLLQKCRRTLGLTVFFAGQAICGKMAEHILRTAWLK